MTAAETGDDRRQRAELSFATVSGSVTHATEVIDALERFVWSFPELEVVSHRARLAGRGLMARRGRGAHPTHQRPPVPATARLNQLMREIVAEALEQIDDERLDLLTVTAVEVEPDLRHALVVLRLAPGRRGRSGGARGPRGAAQGLAGRHRAQARIKRTPELAFAPDPAVRQGALVETLLAEVAPGAIEVVVDPDLYDDPDPTDG